ncbi:MAG: TMEM175 family protein [Bacteroidota bacterium]|nr:TMEM175 family protein [Bacteroidota bacterium]
MNKPILDPGHDKKHFQVERIAFFSDAITAIASTLLILEFKIPPLGRDHSWAQIRDLYAGRLNIPIIGLILSFYSISRLWFKHHALFEKLSAYNTRLLIINQFFLFMIMLIPVTTSCMLEDDNPLFIRLLIYLSNLGLCNIAYFFLMVTALRPVNQLSGIRAAEYHEIRKKDRSLLHGITFAAAAILSLYTIKVFLGRLHTVRYLPVLRPFCLAQKSGYSKTET